MNSMGRCRAILFALTFATLTEPVSAISLCDLALRMLNQSPSRIVGEMTNEHFRPAAPSIAKLTQQAFANTLLKSQQSEGLDLEFVFENIDPEIRNSTTIGEIQQALFIVRLLKSVFPNAEFTFVPALATGSRRLRDRRTIRLEVADIGERALVNPGALEKSNLIPMEFLKPANPLGSDIDRARIRRELGFEDSDRVVHVYTDYPAYYRAFPQLLEGLLIGPEHLKIILSIKYRWFGPETYEATFGRRADFNIHRISQTSGGRATRLLANDTRGIMPALYRASDAAIVLGPINFFEPLQVGTPTVLLQSPQPEFYALIEAPVEYEKYFFSTTLPFIELGRQTGAFHHFEETESALNATFQNLQSPRIHQDRRPFLIKDASGLSPLDRLLKRLVQVISKQENSRLSK